MIHRRPLSSLALALCAACGVGEPLVDEFPPPAHGGGDAVACQLPAECDDAPALQTAQPAARSLLWQGCSTPCGASSPAPPPGTSASDSLLPTDCLAIQPLDSLASDLSCATLRLAANTVAPATAAGADLIAHRVRWRNVNLVIEAEAPLEIIVSNAEVQDARLHLHGPITLRFQDDTSLDRVSISGSSAAAEVVFDRSYPSELTVGDSTDPFPGQLTARHSSFMGPSFMVQNAQLDSVMVDGAFFGAQELISNDGALHDVTMDLGRAMFTPTALQDVVIARCESLSFFGSELRNVHVPRCTGEPTRIYDCNFVGGRLDGVVTGDGGRVERVHFGLGDGGAYELWGLHVQSSAFCGGVESLKVSANAIACSICGEGALEQAEACTLPLGGFDEPQASDDRPYARNFCEALDMLEPCPPPQPARTRPIGMLDGSATGK